MAKDTTSARGRGLTTVRGYTIMEWSGPGVESGSMQRFSVAPAGTIGFDRHWFDTLEEAEGWASFKAPILRIVRGSFAAYVPVAATWDQVEDWVRFNMHATGSLEGSNPLVDQEFEAHDVEVDDVEDVR